MKRIKYLLFTLIIMMFVSVVNVDAASVSVKSVKMVDHSGNVAEVNEPKPNGLNIKFDLAFGSVGDTAKYEVILNNPTNREYEINTEKQFSGSNYISYSYELKDKTNRIKANSEVTLYITVKYENEVPVSSLVNGQYIENNDMGISLLNENNPNTFNNILWVIFILLLLIIITLVIKFTKKKELFVIIFALVLLPVTVFALERLKLTINTKIMVGEMHNVYYLIGYNIKASDLNDVDYIYNDCKDILLKQGNEDYVAYKSCKYIFKKDSKPYFNGQRVKVESKNYLNYNNNDDNDANCSFDTGRVECLDVVLSNEVINMYSYVCLEPNSEAYNSLINEQEGALFMYGICTNDEFNKMNFLSVSDFSSLSDTPEEAVEMIEMMEQRGLHFAIFNTPNEFTMPAHDVFLITNNPGNRLRDAR